MLISVIEKHIIGNTVGLCQGTQQLACCFDFISSFYEEMPVEQAKMLGLWPNSVLVASTSVRFPVFEKLSKCHIWAWEKQKTLPNFFPSLSTVKILNTTLYFIDSPPFMSWVGLVLSHIRCIFCSGKTLEMLRNTYRAYLKTFRIHKTSCTTRGKKIPGNTKALLPTRKPSRFNCAFDFIIRSVYF